MNRRQRVQAALDKKPVDRVPIFMWFHPETLRRLSGWLGVPPEAVDGVMGNDVRQAWIGNNAGMEGVVHARDGEGHTDAWGVVWERREGFNQIVRSPLAGGADPDGTPWRFPDAEEAGLMEPLRRLAARREDFYVGADISPCVFELSARLRGMENALLDLAGPPSASDGLLDACAGHSAGLARRACSPGFSPDWLWTGDDVGGQRGLMMSPALWRERVGPRLARVVAVGREAGLPVAYHCCGGLRPIIPDLIEMGVGVLNPVQGNCPGMDPLELKREYGSRLAFMGGIDTQHLLVRGTAAEVRRQAGRLLEGMTRDGGGYILAASHTAAPETPHENLMALYEAAGLPARALLRRAEAWREAEAARAP